MRNFKGQRDTVAQRPTYVARVPGVDTSMVHFIQVQSSVCVKQYPVASRSHPPYAACPPARSGILNLQPLFTTPFHASLYKRSLIARKALRLIAVEFPIQLLMLFQE